MEKFLPTTKAGLFVKVGFRYDSGNHTDNKGKPYARGYYLTAKPVIVSKTETGQRETFVAGTGMAILLLPVNRQSAKSEADALKKAVSEEESLVAYLCQQRNITLVKDVIKKEVYTI